MEIRTDISHRTTQQLIREFLQSRAASEGKRPEYSNAYSQGALECAIGVVNRDDRYLGIFDFAIWYHDLLRRAKAILRKRKAPAIPENNPQPPCGARRGGHS